jgi:ferric-dicitrate binding protein FerR (iron transport regulator)
MQKKVTKKLPDNLITDFLKGELNPEDTRDLLEWIKSDEANKRKFDEYSEIWITSRAMLKNTGYNAHEGFWKFKKKIGESMMTEVQPVTGRMFRIFFRYAAVILITITLSGLLFYNLGKAEKRVQKACISELVVPLGSKAELTLSDGTTVTLNAGSSLKYDNLFGSKDRIVELVGEGYFTVAKDSERPFMVKTSHLNVMAIGTTFNIKAYSDDKTIETTLVEGSVRIEDISDNGRNEGVVLNPNQKLTFFKADSTLVEESVAPEVKPGNREQPLTVQKSIAVPRVITENVNVEPVISWKENKWIFEKKSLKQIAIELERKYDVRIVFVSEKLKSYRFTGIILAEPIEQVLEVMSITAPINFKLKGNVVTLSENKDFIKVNKDLYVKPE